MQRLLPLRIFASLFIISLFFWGCVSGSQQGGANAARVAEMEKRLAKVEEALADLNQRISVMQFMIDDHENMMRLGERPKATK